MVVNRRLGIKISSLLRITDSQKSLGGYWFRSVGWIPF